jgi:hypothetical protein
VAIGNTILLTWPCGSGGDMVRTCLYPLLHKGNWEYKQLDRGMNGYIVKHGLTWNDNLISFVDEVGQAQTPIMWTRDGDDYIDDTGQSDIFKIIFSIHKRHHYENNIEQLADRCKEAYVLDALHPVVTFICVKDNRLYEVSKKNWLLKTFDNSLNKGVEIDVERKNMDDTIKWREDNPDRANHNFYELGDRKHMMFMDNFFDWESFKWELISFCGVYDRECHIENLPVVKQFWQAWRDEQRIKVE